jgi:hypothetical protein
VGRHSSVAADNYADAAIADGSAAALGEAAGIGINGTTGFDFLRCGTAGRS